MKSILIAVLAAFALAAPSARAQLYYCVGPDGKKSYTSSPEQPNCKLQPSYEPGARKSAPPPPAPAPEAAPAPSAARAAPAPRAPRKVIVPQVAPGEQSGRESLRRQILIHELNSEIKSHNNAVDGANDANADNVRNFFRRKARVHALNILALKRELELLGGNSARN